MWHSAGQCGALQEPMAASGADAQRMFPTMLIEHHRGATDAAQTQIAAGEHQPPVAVTPGGDGRTARVLGRGPGRQRLGTRLVGRTVRDSRAGAAPS